MTFPRLPALAASALLLAAVPAAQAGLPAYGYPGIGLYYGVPLGPPGSGPANPGFFLGPAPGVYRGFYSNGFSLYGPPVPTYAPVPGVFGGSDQRSYGLPPNLIRPGFSLRPTPWNQPSPGQAHLASPVFVPLSQRPSADDPAVPLPQPRPLDGQELPAPRPLPAPVVGEAALPTPAVFAVRVPDGAVVWFDGHRTQQAGPERHFRTPPLPAGETYRYELRAEWAGPDGRPVTQARTVEVGPGERREVDFGRE